jgi:hypothetical protein
LSIHSTPSSSASTKKHTDQQIRNKFGEWLRNVKKCVFSALGIVILAGDKYPSADAQLLQLYGQYMMSNIETSYFLYGEVKAAHQVVRNNMPVSAKVDGRTAVTDFLKEHVTSE